MISVSDIVINAAFNVVQVPFDVIPGIPVLEISRLDITIDLGEPARDHNAFRSNRSTRRGAGRNLTHLRI